MYYFLSIGKANCFPKHEILEKGSGTNGIFQKIDFDSTHDQYDK